MDQSPDTHGNTPSIPDYRGMGRSLGVLYEGVGVVGLAAGTNGIPTLPAIIGRVLKWPVDVARRSMGLDKPALQDILTDVSGVLFPGETMLVLGRPGAGTSTLLKILSNDRESFQEVRGNVQYAGLPSHYMARHYRSETVYVAEDDIHFPTLPVKHTMAFATRLRKPANDSRSDSDFAEQVCKNLLESVGLSHTANTVVGDALVRGVSGGERKRVTLVEALSINSAVAAWDNPTRGLDSSSADDFVRLIQVFSKRTGMNNIVAMYQVSEAIFQCFDRVTLLYDGQMIFHGKVTDAKEYFIQLGFECRHRQTTPDFLTAITSPAERLIRKDSVGVVPSDASGLAKAFRESDHFSQLERDIKSYKASIAADDNVARVFEHETRQVRSRFSLPSAIAPRPLWSQVYVAMRRHYQLLWGDKRTFMTLIMFNILNAVINGSSYYMAPKDVTGSYEKSSALFFSLIYFYLNALTEATSTVRSRSILLKQKQYGFIHPTAFLVAQTLAEIPIAFFHCILFACLYYWQINLQQTASAFWIFVLIVFTHYSAVQGLFRALGAWSPNIPITLMMAGSAIPVGLLYSGFGPTRPTQHRWGSWLRRASPSPWALEALMGNEFDGITLTCSEDDMVPTGSSYNDVRYQACSITGSNIGQTKVAGSAYLSEHFGFTRNHLWRNFGIILVLWFLYVCIGCVGLMLTTREISGSRSRVFKRCKGHDEESLPKSTGSSTTVTETAQSLATQASKATGRPFTFRDISYHVRLKGQNKQLLQDVSGYAKPGQLTALMGASGAGKTTLLDVLSQRKHTGRIEGTFLLDGKPLDEDFARSCGFVMQQDIHEPNSTVREALIFSARMRQPQHVPDQDKLAYVEHVIHLLDMEAIAEALIGETGDGQLSVEERKRVTIGVELAARPSSLLFLDEPTSGLDSQAAFSLVTFLRRIAAEGIPIICTIHQPSGVLFDMFDHVLLLAPGGKTIYFGETGKNSAKLVEYFGKNGAVIGSNVNPAEFILSTVTRSTKTTSWADIWDASAERQSLLVTIANLDAESLEHDRRDNLSDPRQRRQCAARFALPLWAQIVAVTKRHWISVWRDGMYNFSKITKSLFVEIFIAFSFFKAGSTLQGLQNNMIAILLLSWVIPSTCADLQEIWFRKWDIFTAREHNGIYDWKALLTALVVVELPWQLGTYTFIFLATYWTVGFPNETPISGFNYLMWLLLSIFSIGYSQLLAAMFSNPLMGGYANSLFWVILMVFSGVLTPHAYMNSFYRWWLIWVDPMRYFFGATVGTVLHNIQVTCTSGELTTFEPPIGQTCAAYAQSFLNSSLGYIVDGDSTDICGYCQYSTGDDYLTTLDYAYDEHWWNFAVFLGFCLTNFCILFIIVRWTKGRLQRYHKS